MSGMTFFFLLLGVAVVVTDLMKLVEWLDTPRKHSRRSARPVHRASRRSSDRAAALLDLERARLAA